MQAFEVDDDLVELVWRLASPKPFQQLTFSDALRKVLTALAPTDGRRTPTAGRGAKQARHADLSADDLLAELAQMSPSELKTRLPEFKVERRVREPKADIRALTKKGYLTEGQKLFPVDYQGQRLGKHVALLREGKLEFQGQLFSPSGLAEKLLKEAGFISDSVRGPAHWVTESGDSIASLWAKELAKRGRP
jgi:hypothetical protein